MVVLNGIIYLSYSLRNRRDCPFGCESRLCMPCVPLSGDLALKGQSFYFSSYLPVAFAAGFFATGAETAGLIFAACTALKADSGSLIPSFSASIC